MKTKSTLRNFLALAGSSLLAVSSSHAATLFFDGSDITTPNGASGITSGASPHTWGNSTANWDNGTSYVAWNNGDDADIRGSGGGNKTINLASSVTVGSLTWTNTGGTMFMTPVGGSTMTINGGISFGNPAGVNWSVPVTLGGSQTWSMGGTNSSGKSISGGTDLNGHTLTWNTSGTNTNLNAHPAHSGITGSGSLVKDGVGYVRLQGTNDYTGTTTVSTGTLYAQGTLSSSAVTVEANGTIGSNNGSSGGSLGNGLIIQAGGNLDLTGATLGSDSTGILSLTGGSLTLGNLTFEDIVGWNWMDADVGTYELIDGAFSVDWGDTAFLDEGSAYDFGNGKGGYFTSGSLNAVVFVIPEPSTAVLASLGLLALLRRRR